MLLLLTLPADTTRPSLCYERWFGRSKVNLYIHSEFLIIGTRTSMVYSKPFLNTINPSEQHTTLLISSCYHIVYSQYLTRHYTCTTILNLLTCLLLILYRFFSHRMVIATCWFILFSYVVIVDSSGCVYSVDGDLRYMVYRWGFLIWIIPSKYQSHEPINWARTTCFVISIYHMIWCLIHARCVCSRHNF